MVVVRFLTSLSNIFCSCSSPSISVPLQPLSTTHTLQPSFACAHPVSLFRSLSLALSPSRSLAFSPSDNRSFLVHTLSRTPSRSLYLSDTYSLTHSLRDSHLTPLPSPLSSCEVRIAPHQCGNQASQNQTIILLIKNNNICIFFILPLSLSESQDPNLPIPLKRIHTHIHTHYFVRAQEEHLYLSLRIMPQKSIDPAQQKRERHTHTRTHYFVRARQEHLYPFLSLSLSQNRTTDFRKFSSIEGARLPILERITQIGSPECEQLGLALLAAGHEGVSPGS